MDVREIFKTKAVELASKLQARFPSKLVFVVPALQAADADELFQTYRQTIHKPFSKQIRSREESFFMTTSDFDDPMQMVGVLRGLWTQMSAADKEAVWKYMDMFEKLIKL
jgi:hypothetical protein